MSGKKQDYDELENQIGSLGGQELGNEEIELGNEEKSLGKLKHLPNIKPELSDEENEEKEAFLNRSRRHSVLGKKNDLLNDSVVPIGDGWIPINRDELGIRSQFYPDDWEFAIRPATVQAIKNWTSIDEERLDQVNNVFNDIIKTCVKITSNSGGVSWENINSWDRFWFVMKIREYTFVHGESKVEFTDSCSECDEDIDFTLTSDGLFYEFPDEELVEKYWTGKNWEIDPTEYDVDEDPITLYTPTLGKDQAIINWATERYRATNKIDETFIKFLPWLLNKPSRDMQMFDRQVQKIYKDYKSWSIDMFSFMDDVIKNITINPSEKLKTICPHCGKEVTSNVRFPNGIKAIFNVTTKAKKFGSR